MLLEKLVLIFTPKGRDKSQILPEIKEWVDGKEPILFFGDKTEKGGNDYPLAKLMNEVDNCSYYQTEGWKETQEILESLND